MVDAADYTPVQTAMRNWGHKIAYIDGAPKLAIFIKAGWAYYNNPANSFNYAGKVRASETSAYKAAEISCKNLYGHDYKTRLELKGG